jgi:hypothetical protein
MSKITIYLSIDEPGKLHLRDSEGHAGEDTITTGVNKGDTIVWTLDKDSGIKAITGIAAKSESPNLFSKGPSFISDSEWIGVIAEIDKGEEDYYIEYVLPDGTLKRDDPKIILPPV